MLATCYTHVALTYRVVRLIVSAPNIRRERATIFLHKFLASSPRIQPIDNWARVPHEVYSIHLLAVGVT